MNEEWNIAEALFEMSQRYPEQFGPLPPIGAELDPELLYVVLEMALEDGLEIDAPSIERALSEVDQRLAFFEELDT